MRGLAILIALIALCLEPSFATPDGSQTKPLENSEQEQDSLLGSGGHVGKLILDSKKETINIRSRPQTKVAEKTRPHFLRATTMQQKQRKTQTQAQLWQSQAGKKGAAFTLRNKNEPGSWVENLPKLIALKPYWSYSWNSKRIKAQPANIEFVPMIWGAWNEAALKSTMDKIRVDVQSGKVKRLLAYNEPDSKTVRSARPSYGIYIYLSYFLRGWAHMLLYFSFSSLASELDCPKGNTILANFAIGRCSNSESSRRECYRSMDARLCRRSHHEYNITHGLSCCTLVWRRKCDCI
jgi:hypothetical protein